MWCTCSSLRDLLIHDIPTNVCKLHKALYGLKQAPRASFTQLSSWLLAYGFKTSKADPSLFILQHGDVILYLFVYLDDLVIIGSKSLAIDLFIRDLGSPFLAKTWATYPFSLASKSTTQ